MPTHTWKNNRNKKKKENAAFDVINNRNVRIHFLLSLYWFAVLCCNYDICNRSVKNINLFTYCHLI